MLYIIDSKEDDMENRITTEEAQIFLTEYYKRHDIESTPDDWELIKKYKNFKGLTCRDFSLKSQDVEIKCIVVFDTRNAAIQVIEDESYDFFVKQAANAPVFYYAPAICNEGLVFYFEAVAQIDKFGAPATDNERYKEMLESKLLGIFGSKNVFSLSSGLYFSFPNTEIDQVISILEKSLCRFNMELFSFMDSDFFQPVFPDVDIATHRFPEDINKTQEELINLFLTLTNTIEDWTTRDYAHIKSLLKSIRNRDELIAVLNIANGWDSAANPKLQELYSAEITRRKNMQIINDIWSKKQKVQVKSIIPDEVSQKEIHNSIVRSDEDVDTEKED